MCTGDGLIGESGRGIDARGRELALGAVGVLSVAMCEQATSAMGVHGSLALTGYIIIHFVRERVGFRASLERYYGTYGMFQACCDNCYSSLGPLYAFVY